MSDTAKTVQLRRYFIKPGELDAFIEWWEANIPALRKLGGFAIEFAYADHANNQFVWAVSTPGDETAFSAIEHAYNELPERARAFEGIPQRVENALVGFVTVHA